MKRLQQTAVTLRLETSTPPNPAFKSRMQFDFIISDTAEWFLFSVAVFIGTLLIIWREIIESIVATGQELISIDNIVNWYFIIMTIGIFGWAFFATGGGLKPLPKP